MRQRGDEVRVPRGAGAQLGRAFGTGVDPRGRRDEGADLGLVEAVEGHPLGTRAGQTGEDRGQVRGLVPSVRHDDEQTRHAGGCDVLEQPEAGSVGGVQVLEQDRQRRDVAQVCGDGLEPAQPGALGVERRWPVTASGEEGGDPLGNGDVGTLDRHRSNNLLPGPQGRHGLVVRATAPGDGQDAARGELLQQSGLAHTGFALDDDQRGAAVPGGGGRPAEDVQVGAAAHE